MVDRCVVTFCVSLALLGHSFWGCSTGKHCARHEDHCLQAAKQSHADHHHSHASDCSEHRNPAQPKPAEENAPHEPAPCHAADICVFVAKLPQDAEALDTVDSTQWSAILLTSATRALPTPPPTRQPSLWDSTLTDAACALRSSVLLL